MKKSVMMIVASAAVLLSGVSANALAQVNVDIVIGTPPPPPRYEMAPVPRHGYIWIAGYWAWGGRHYLWVPGHWERARPGYVYRRPEWHHEGNRWMLERGGWEAERHDNGRRARLHDDRHDQPRYYERHEHREGDHDGHFDRR